MPFQAVATQRPYEQVAGQVTDLVTRGEFKPGDRLPPERDLAKLLQETGLSEIEIERPLTPPFQTKPFIHFAVVGRGRLFPTRYAGCQPLLVFSRKVVDESSVARTA